MLTYMLLVQLFHAAADFSLHLLVCGLVGLRANASYRHRGQRGREESFVKQYLSCWG